MEVLQYLELSKRYMLNFICKSVWYNIKYCINMFVFVSFLVGNSPVVYEFCTIKVDGIIIYQVCYIGKLLEPVPYHRPSITFNGAIRV